MRALAEEDGLDGEAGGRAEVQLGDGSRGGRCARTSSISHELQLLKCSTTSSPRRNPRHHGADLPHDAGPLVAQDHGRLRVKNLPSAALMSVAQTETATVSTRISRSPILS
ncbi:hypothetical protein VM1G_11975 [Cytospora mali]|uniref:Uncharacterized protein n=1 Tax=Cytospora mali TaxID=578113 RepID=A0A194WEA9_CYTMA|nr:hypothetical protein VM1G_11975 [Valsa mali]